MNYAFKTSKRFWRSFYELDQRQQTKAREVFNDVFKKDPYDQSLRTHKIHRLSAIWRKTIMSATVEGDLKVVFFQDGNVIRSVDIGSHAIYDKG